LQVDQPLLARQPAARHKPFNMSARYRATDFEERDYYPPPRRSAPDFDNFERRRAITRSPPPVREREERGLPSFLREDNRRAEAGAVVLRQRDVETFDRHAPRSPSPQPLRVREERIVRRPRSVSPPALHEHERDRMRIVERERIRSPSIERRSSPSPVRYVHRRRRSSDEEQHIHTRIVEKERTRVPSPSPSPSPPPVIKGPTIEREVITHYTDIDHGVIRAKQPTPPPPPRPHHHHHDRTRETDIDISLSRNRTDIDVDIRRSRSRSRHDHRHHGNRPSHYHDDLIVDDSRLRERFSRRSRSAAPPRDEEREITSRIDSRGRMGEAWGGATKDWTIVDVPPGTERVRMDGVGGGSTDTTWSKYSGVRRTQFIPERDGAMVVSSSKETRDRDRDRTSLTLYDREREIDIITDRHITRTPVPPPPPPPKEMWTEITKDLVCREALEELGYAYEETKWFFYIMKYLRYVCPPQPNLPLLAPTNYASRTTFYD
jgi:hypothetical protein